MAPLPPPAPPVDAPMDATWAALDGAGALMPKPVKTLSGRAISGRLLPVTFPPPRSPASRVHAYLASPYAHTALQLVAGVAFLSLFVVVPSMRFPMSCQASVLFAALVLQLSPRANAGARIMAAVVAVGMLTFGSALGGAAVSVAWAAAGGGSNSLVSTVKATLAGPPGPAKSAILAKLAAAQSAAAGAGAGAAPPVKATPSLGVAMAALKTFPIVGGSYYGILCGVGVAVMGLASVVRCEPGNPAVGALGSLVAVLAGLVMANAGAVPVVGLKGFWKSAFLDLLRAGLVAAGATLVSGALVLPSRASTACLASTARVLEGVGQTVSGYAGRRPPGAVPGGGLGSGKVAEPATTQVSRREVREAERVAALGAAVAAASAAAAKQKGGGATPSDPTAAATAALGCDLDDATILAGIRADTQPPHEDAGGLSPAAKAAVNAPFPAGDPRAPPVVAWRSVLAGARAELREALFEPPFLFRGGGTPFRFKRWGQVVEGVDGLIGRAAALEEVIGRPTFAADAAALKASPGGQAAVEAFQTATAAVAAGCAAGAAVLRDPPAAAAAWRARPPGLHGAGWDGLQGRLVEAVTAAQASWLAAIAPRSSGGGGGGDAKAPSPDYKVAVRMRTMAHAAMLLGGVVEAAQGLEKKIIAALDLPPVAADDVEAPAAASPKSLVAASDPTPTKREKEPHPTVLWAGSLLAGLTGALVWIRLLKVAARTLPACLISRAARREAASSRMVQFGLKYWLATSAAFVATILLLWKVCGGGGERGRERLLRAPRARAHTQPTLTLSIVSSSSSTVPANPVRLAAVQRADRHRHLRPAPRGDDAVQLAHPDGPRPGGRGGRVRAHAHARSPDAWGLNPNSPGSHVYCGPHQRGGAFQAAPLPGDIHLHDIATLPVPENGLNHVFCGQGRLHGRRQPGDHGLVFIGLTLLRLHRMPDHPGGRPGGGGRPAGERVGRLCGRGGEGGGRRRRRAPARGGVPGGDRQGRDGSPRRRPGPGPGRPAPLLPALHPGPGPDHAHAARRARRHGGRGRPGPQAGGF